MALSQYVGNQAGKPAFPKTGGAGGKKTGGVKPRVPKKRISSEQRAEEARLNDPYGDHQNRGTRKETRVVRRRVRRRRVKGGKTQSNYGTTQTKGSKKAKSGGQTQLAQGSQGPANKHMMSRMNSQSNLNRMTSNFQSAKQGGARGPQTTAGKKMFMLGNLETMMNNDYAAMKAGNDKDTAFTYRTSEARQLVAALGMMQNQDVKKKDKKKDKDSGKASLSPAAFSRQKGLLRNLVAMSAPDAPLPEGLPEDYKPFESVA